MGKRKNSKYTYVQNSKLNIWWIIVVLVIMVVISFIYVRNVNKLIYQHIYNNVKELSEQTATQLNLAITDQEHFVEIMIDSINRGYFKTEQDIFDRYKGDLGDYHFTRLVILDRKGNGTTSDGHTVNNYSDIEEFFKQGEIYLSENKPSTVSNNQVNIYSKTFKLNGKDRVLMATINTEDYESILLRKLFGKGGTYLINNNGTVLIDSFDTIEEKNANIYEYIKNTYELKNEEARKIDNMRDSIKRHEVGTFDVKLGNEPYFIHYEKVNINDWYVITTAANSTIAKELIMLIIILQAVCLLVTIIIISICIYINISNQKKNKKIYDIAYIDPVTLLGNEAYFKENSNNYLQNSTKNKYVISLDINKFKALNNIHGYEFCNNILKELGEKLSNTLPTDNITCRISADVFTAIFSYNKNIKNLISKIFNQASKLKIEGKQINLNLSIGIYKITPEDKDINTALDKAYMARAKIKGLYDENYYIFDNVLQSQLIEEQKIESSMEDALKNEEFKIVYQPKIYTNNEKLAGAEALVRWNKDGKMIPPNEFIPLFEKNKFLVKLDLYIFEQVCKDLNKWKEKYNYMPTISINVSKTHFVNENFIEEYVKITDKYNIKRSNIDLEITESATIDEDIDVLDVMKKIKEKGFIISIDDFGTGYSSLSMLQTMPIDIIKIDKVFVDKADLKSDKNIINYIMLIANRLGVKTIVEGVETKEQVEFVKKIKCDIIQGYYYSKPLMKKEFEEYFNKFREK